MYGALWRIVCRVAEWFAAPVERVHILERKMVKLNNRSAAVWISVAAAVMFVAAFMPWGQIRATPRVTFNGTSNGMFDQRSFGPGALGQNPFGGMMLTATINGWNGSITPGGINLPNWLAVVIALAVAAMAWLSVMEVWQSPRFLGMILAIVGLIQIVFTLVILTSSEQASVGGGILLAAAAFAGMVIACCWLAVSRRPTAVPQPIS